MSTDWYKQAQAQRPQQMTQSPTPPSPTDVAQNDAAAAEEIRTRLKTLIRTSVLPSLINPVAMSLHQIVNRELGKFQSLLAANNLQVNDVDTRRFLCMIIDAVNAQYSITGNTGVQNQVLNSPAVISFINALINTYTPGKEDIGRSSINRAVMQNKPRNV